MKQKPIELMHYSFGESEGNICGTCCNLRTVQYNAKRLRKCVAYGGFHSSKADWAMRWPACGLYGKPVSQQMVSDIAKRTFARIGICKDDDRSTEGQIEMEALKDGKGDNDIPTLTPPNEPLTWSELAEMEGQPVYIVETGAKRYWALVMFVSKDRADFVTVHNPDDYGDKELYGESWVAYRRLPEGEGKPTEPPNM